MAISTKKIYQLQELFQAKSNYLMIIRNVETGKDMKVKLGTLLTGKIVAIWDPEEEYNTGDNVDYNLKIWKSLIDANVGNIPTEGVNWTEVSASEVIGVLPDSLQRVVSKTSHGFAVKDVITLNGSGVHVKVSNPTGNKFVGLVTEVIDANSFRIHTAGYVTALSGLTAGAIHYGQADGTLSTTVTDMPVLFADSTTSGYILASGSGSGSGIKIGTASGTDTYTVAFTPPFTSFPPSGTMIIVQFNNINTGACTLNIDSLGAIPIRRERGAELLAGDLYSSTWYPLVFSAIHAAWIVLHPCQVPNSATAKGLFVDTNGRIRLADGSVYDPATKGWVHTGMTDDDTELVKWQNDSEELIFRLLTDKTAEFGNSGTHVIEVADGITNGNSFLLVPSNQLQAYQVQDKNSNKIFTLKTTTGDPAVILHGFEKNFTGAWQLVVKQAFTTIPTTAGAQNVIASIPAVDGLPLKVKVNFAFAAIGAGRLISIDSLIAIALNQSGTTAGTVQAGNSIYSGGPANGGFNININDTTDEIEIRFQNESGTGYAYTVWIEYEFIML